MSSRKGYFHIGRETDAVPVETTKRIYVPLLTSSTPCAECGHPYRDHLEHDDGRGPAPCFTDGCSCGDFATPPAE